LSLEFEVRVPAPDLHSNLIAPRNFTRGRKPFFEQYSARRNRTPRNTADDVFHGYGGCARRKVLVAYVQTQLRSSDGLSQFQSFHGNHARSARRHTYPRPNQEPVITSIPHET